MEKLIAREKETALLKEYISSDRPEFIAIYGRRRVGKTFLVKSLFGGGFDFYATGIVEGTKEEELEAFNTALMNYGYKKHRQTNWLGAFNALGDLLKEKAAGKPGPIVVFIDELPCLDTRNSGFIHALDYFWNSIGAWMDSLKFIVCGSATSWMIRNLIDNHGGLHNRITHELHLHPFNLAQTEEYFKSRGFQWSRLNIMQIYMCMGGIPYYLSLIRRDEDITDNIDRLFFGEDAELGKEFDRLFSSLFRSPENYIGIINILAANKSGLTRKEIATKLKTTDNGHLGDMLEDLRYCDFVRRYNNGLRKNGGIYQLTDFYSAFYYQFCKGNTTDPHFWRHLLGTPTENTWYGLAFERVCMAHIGQIVTSLHYDTIHTEYYSWRSRDTSPKVQIDLVIDRADNNISLCEMKYSQTDYTLTKAEYRKILDRIEAFRRETLTRKGLQPVIVTTFGLKRNEYSSVIFRTVIMDDLFEKNLE